MDIVKYLAELLSGNECYVLILGVFVVSFFIIKNNNQHQQEMEKIRLEQFNDLLKNIKKQG